MEKVEWDDNNMKDEDFGSVKGISEKLTADLLGKIDSSLKNAMAAPFLPIKQTVSRPYSKVSPAYPVGCYKCTALGHSMEDCNVNFMLKRALFNKEENSPASKK